MFVPYGDWRTKFPVSSSTAATPVAIAVIVFFVAQDMRLLDSDNTRSKVFVMVRVVDEAAVIGLSQLVTHTTVQPRMLLHHMTRYKLLLEQVVVCRRIQEPNFHSWIRACCWGECLFHV